MADDDDYDMFDNTTYAPCSVGRALEEWCDAVPSSMLSGSYWLEGSSLLYSAFMAVLLVTLAHRFTDRLYACGVAFVNIVLKKTDAQWYKRRMIRLAARASRVLAHKAVTNVPRIALRVIQEKLMASVASCDAAYLKQNPMPRVWLLKDREAGEAADVGGGDATPVGTSGVHHHAVHGAIATLKSYDMPSELLAPLESYAKEHFPVGQQAAVKDGSGTEEEKVDKQLRGDTADADDALTFTTTNPLSRGAGVDTGLSAGGDIEMGRMEKPKDAKKERNKSDSSILFGVNPEWIEWLDGVEALGESANAEKVVEKVSTAIIDVVQEIISEQEQSQEQFGTMVFFGINLAFAFYSWGQYVFLIKNEEDGLQGDWMCFGIYYTSVVMYKAFALNMFWLLTVVIMHSFTDNFYAISPRESHQRDAIGTPHMGPVPRNRFTMIMMAIVFLSWLGQSWQSSCLCSFFPRSPFRSSRRTTCQ